MTTTATLQQPVLAVPSASTHQLDRTRTLLPMWLGALPVLRGTLTTTAPPRLVQCVCWGSMLVVRRRHVRLVQPASSTMTSTRWYHHLALCAQTVLLVTTHLKDHRSALTVPLATLTLTTTLQRHVMEVALYVQQARTRLVEQPRAPRVRLVRWTWMQTLPHHVHRVSRVGILLPLRQHAHRVPQATRTWTKMRLRCA